MKILIDMNLSPDWVKVLELAGWETVHWSVVGDNPGTQAWTLSYLLTDHLGSMAAMRR